MARNVALFGGTFDPVHFGHLIAARAVAEQGGFDRITFVPAACPPHKPPAQAAGEHRLAMLELAIGDEPLFDICTAELHRDGPSFTLDTLLAMREQYGQDAKLHWIIGADMLETLPTWHRVDEVLQLAQLVVMTRPPWQTRVGAVLDGLRERFDEAQVQAIQAHMIEVPLIDISSTTIRSRVAAEQPARYLTPELVISYIETHGLYC